MEKETKRCGCAWCDWVRDHYPLAKNEPAPGHDGINYTKLRMTGVIPADHIALSNGASVWKDPSK